MRVNRHDQLLDVIMVARGGGPDGRRAHHKLCPLRLWRPLKSPREGDGVAGCASDCDVLRVGRVVGARVVDEGKV